MFSAFAATITTHARLPRSTVWYPNPICIRDFDLSGSPRLIEERLDQTVKPLSAFDKVGRETTQTSSPRVRSFP
jgi:hypothetical protein